MAMSQNMQTKVVGVFNNEGFAHDFFWYKVIIIHTINYSCTLM